MTTRRRTSKDERKKQNWCRLMQSHDCCCVFSSHCCVFRGFLSPRSISRCAPPATSILRLQALTWWSRSAQLPGSWRLAKEKWHQKTSRKPMSLFDNSAWLRLSLYMLICILCWLQYLQPSLLRQVIHRLMMVNFMLDSVWESSWARVRM